MIIGNSNTFRGKGIVAFIDLLGFSNEIQKNWDSKIDNPLDRILLLKENLPIIDEITLSRLNLKSTNKKYFACRVQTISDSMIVSIGFDENISMGDYVVAHIAFFNTIFNLWRKTIDIGFTVRGGIDYGDIYWNEKEIIGPAFISAYELETKMAKISRIILSSNANQFLKNMYLKYRTMWDGDLLKYLIRDVDGLLKLNPHNLYETEIDRQVIIIKLEEMRDSSSEYNKNKYAALIANLNVNDSHIEINELGMY